MHFQPAENRLPHPVISGYYLQYMEWLPLWGITAGFLFHDIFKDLAKDAAKAFLDDFLRKSLSSVLSGKCASESEKYQKEFTIATGKALKEFLSEVEEQLKDAELPPGDLPAFVEPFGLFINHPKAKAELLSAFLSSSPALDSRLLNQTWNDLRPAPPALPRDFSWDRLARRYSRRATEIREASPELREILNSQNLNFITTNVRQLAPVDPGWNLAGYSEAMRERYSRLRLESLDATGSYYRELKLWSVFIPQNALPCQEYLPSVLELPREHLRRLRQSGELEFELDPESVDELQQRRREYLDQSPRGVLEVVEDPAFPLLVILGDPGSGKSSLLQALLLRWTELPSADQPSYDLPILIELRSYAEARDGNSSFLDYLQQAPNAPWHFNRHRLHAELEAGRVRLLFDGLDEVFDPNRRKEVAESIIRFSNQYPRVHIVLTSRVIGYSGEHFRNAGFHHFMLQELEDDQIAEFLLKWHRDTYRSGDSAERDQKLGRLERAIHDSRAIRELAGNPLLLTMMAILNRNQDLPRERAGLYEQCSRLLLYQWKVEDALRADPDLVADALAIGLREKQSILRRVAREMQAAATGPLGNLIPEGRLESVVSEALAGLVSQPLRSARALIRQLRERNFILCFIGGTSYAFVHRTFLEYFCAEDLRQRFEHENSITADQLKLEVFGNHWTEETWHEALCLLVGMLHPSKLAPILDFLLDQPDPEFTCQHVFLAARCLGEVRHRNLITWAEGKLRTALESLLSFDLPFFYAQWESEARIASVIRSRAVQLLAQVFVGQDTCSRLKEWAQSHEDSDVRHAAVQELARGWKSDPDTLHWLKERAQSDQDSDVRQAAVQELARGWKSDPDTLPILKERTQFDEHFNVRYAAVQELARGWKSDPDTLPIFKVRAQSDEHWVVRQAAVQELARGWKSDPDTLRIFKVRAQSDEHWVVRQAAVRELAQGWKSDPDTLHWLKERAQSDQDSDVRQAAVQELARGWKSDPDTLPWLKERAQSDEHWAVRYAAVQELARGWKSDPDTHRILKERARSDQNSGVRQAAVRELARGWKSDPDTLHWLEERAQSDQDSDVRHAAVQELARGWKSDPDTLHWLKERAQSDEHWAVRYAAVQELARGWKSDPDTLRIFKVRAQSDEHWVVRQAAVQELARGWKSDPDTLRIFKVRAQSDEHWVVRQAAVRELARGWKSDPDTLRILKERAQSDEHFNVRHAAVGELARGWKSDLDTLRILKERAQSDQNSDVRQAAVQELARGWKSDPSVQAFLASHVSPSEMPLPPQ